MLQQMGKGKSWRVECRCGWQDETPRESRVMAEVVADRHESAARRAYQHDTNLVEVTA